MSWEEIKIGSICKIKHGYAFKGEFFSNEGEYILLSPGNFFESGGLKSKGEKEKYYVGDFPSDYILNEEDLLVVMTDLIQNAPILGGCAIVPEDNKFLHNQRLGKITNLDENKIDKKFLYYCLNEENYRGQIRGSATGATVRHTAPERIYNAKVNIPTSLETQKRIAAILSAYDDLIENNLKRIKLLEETAQNIYKEWFVNFRFPNYEHTEFDAESGLPVGWEMKTFEEILDFKTGKLNSNANVVDGKYPFFTCSQEVFKTNTFSFDTEAVLLGGNNASANYPLKYFKGQFDAYQRTYIIKPKNNVISHKYIFLYLKERLNLLKQMSTGTSTKFLTLKMLNQMVLLVPDEISNNAFESIVNPIFDQILILQEQNEKLKEARDILLPRLMNRTIEV